MMQAKGRQDENSSSMGNQSGKFKVADAQCCNNYDVVVKTGDRPKSGTDANVFIILHGNTGKSPETKLDACFRDDFERGQTDTFHIKKQQFDKVVGVELWRDQAGLLDSWNIDTITVINTGTKEEIVFPVFRWIRHSYHYYFIPYDTSLPQNDGRKDQRMLELEEKRQDYQLARRFPGCPAQIKNIPADEQFSFDYKWDLKKQKYELFALSRIKIITTGTWNTVQDIYSMFTDKGFTKPTDVERWRDDKKFAMQRLAGVNNICIQLCTQIPDKLGVTEDMVLKFLEGQTMQEALDNKRIFIVDHEILLNSKTKEGLVVCAPIALFYQQKDGTLIPIAIQLFQNKSDDNPVFLPSDPTFTWIAAKMWFNNADAQIHQSITHLGATHLFMEGIPVVTHRNLSQSHPIFKLLAPHFLYLIAINVHGLNKLLDKGGFFDKSMAVGVVGGLELIARHRERWRFNVEGTLPNDLKNRGLDDPALIPQYYFRQDAVDVYEAIHKYVNNYVNLYYKHDSDVTSDMEIQSWRAEMVKPIEEGGMEMKGVPGHDDGLTSIGEVIDLVTPIIYTCSVGHAAANFAQYEEYSFLPNYPSTLRGQPPKNKDALSETDVIAFFADKDTTYTLLIITKILSGRSTRALGDFEVNYIYDPMALPVVEEFRKDLKRISANNKERNKSRNPKYTYLDPEEIPNAISI